jgi:hypothetical protein
MLFWRLTVTKDVCPVAKEIELKTSWEHGRADGQEVAS